MISAERGAAANTLDAYGRDLGDASEFLAGGLATASGPDLRAYIQDLARRGMAPSTITRKRSALRRFFRFLFQEGCRSDDPTSQLDAPKARRHVPDVLSREEMSGVIAWVSQRPPRRRGKALIDSETSSLARRPAP